MTAPLDLNDFNYPQRKELQIALRTFLTDLNLPMFVTINFNRRTNLRRAYKQLREFHKMIDKDFLGRRFYLLPKEERTFFIAMPEHLNSNFHYHLLLRPPPEKELHFLFNAWFYLKKIVPSATIKISRLKTNDDVRKTSFYSCKDAIYVENYDNFIISTQFSNLKWKS